MKKLLALFGFVERDEEDLDLITSEEEFRERGERLRRPLAMGGALVVCRGNHCLERREELLQALRGGRGVLIDLRGVEREEGQALLDDLSGAVEASQGVVMRLAPALFLALAHHSFVEVLE